MKKLLLAAAAATAFVSTAALAIVTFDPETGYGFVGKGDVQQPLGWNNQALQKNAGGVSFAWEAQDTYDVTCEWDTVTPVKTVHHSITVPRHTRVNSTIAYDTRNNSKGKDGPITGFNLTGLGATTYQGTVPEPGQTCPGASSVALITAVELVSSSGGGLSFSYGGTSYPL